MNVRIEKLASLVLVSLTIFGLMAMNIDTAAAQYPPLPFLYVAVSGNTADIYLMGDGFTDLDPYWDINGLDLVLRFDASAMQAMVPGSPEQMIDPDYWFTSFWPAGIVAALPYPGYVIDNINGYVRVVMVGLPLDGFHTAPFGQGRVMSVTFDSPITTPMRLEKLPPGRPELPDFGPEYFALDLAQFDTAMPVPFVGGPLANIDFEVSDETPVANVPITFTATGYHPTIIALYEWDFDSDGVVDATGSPVTHAYSGPGFHKATLKVTDYLGNTASASGRMLCNENTLLQNAWVEHKVYDVSADEDIYNTLYVRARNLGTAAGDVKAVFSVFDKRTGMPVGPTFSVTGVVPAGDRLDMTANFDPSAYGYEPGTEAGFEVNVDMSYFSDFTGEWVSVDSFKLVFKVVP